jgi:hypothetical protein
VGLATCQHEDRLSVVHGFCDECWDKEKRFRA